MIDHVVRSVFTYFFLLNELHVYYESLLGSVMDRSCLVISWRAPRCPAGPSLLSVYFRNGWKRRRALNFDPPVFERKCSSPPFFPQDHDYYFVIHVMNHDLMAHTCLWWCLNGTWVLNVHDHAEVRLLPCQWGRGQEEQEKEEGRERKKKQFRGRHRSLSVTGGLFPFVAWLSSRSRPSLTSFSF